MNHNELVNKINNQDISEDRKRRGIMLSMLETTKNILVDKGIISESDFNKYYDKNLKRNFGVKE